MVYPIPSVWSYFYSWLSHLASSLLPGSSDITSTPSGWDSAVSSTKDSAPSSRPSAARTGDPPTTTRLSARATSRPSSEDTAVHRKIAEVAWDSSPTPNCHSGSSFFMINFTLNTKFKQTHFFWLHSISITYIINYFKVLTSFPFLYIIRNDSS